MVSPLFQRMSDGILAALGEDAVFNGDATLVTKINLHHGVQLTGLASDGGAYQGEYSAERDVATISSALDPRIGDRFQFVLVASGGTPDVPLGKAYRLEKRVRDNGANRQFVVLELP